MSEKEISIDEYDYSLPDDRIAKFPLPERDKSKLLIYDKGAIRESVFESIAYYLPADSLIVLNNTRVIRARLLFEKETGAHIEVFCLEPEKPRDYALCFQARGECRWSCLVGNLKRWKSGVLKRTFSIGESKIIFSAERINSSENNSHSILFRWDNTAFTFAEILDAAGILPIPPYLHRETQQSDLQTYQTVYSRIKGSVAAPTAGLHFTPAVLADLEARGFRREEVTLHVGAGTFKPVQTPTIGEHEMHGEYISLSRSTIANLLDSLGRITAVGTTTVRTLESLYYIGVALAQKNDKNTEIPVVEQWTPYNHSFIPADEALRNILHHLDSQGLDTLIAMTRIIIVPGYRFRLVNNMITNFHQPRSTLLLLVSAFVGGRWREIYDYALANNFRFLSYGDSSLILNTQDLSCYAE
ncbi:MAG: S-adenosylmethionine:tRNA ribosyltransferase-isomerase [Tannerella sp.]|jgi:S-adenosylmethionine:tRNA ribosyltransferase-isomerase|nr:S-adenosylmethionine:tRNA ribosyltransferase-isomerase [Tannerella sp.]